MSGDQDTKAQQIALKLQDYGKPALLCLRVITWELPLSWAIIFASSSAFYVILHNLSIRTFSILGLLLLWLDYYCSQNNVKIPELTEVEKEELGYLCSKLIGLQSKLNAVILHVRTIREQDPNYVFRQICIYLGIAIALSWCVNNLLLLYLTASSILLMVGMYAPQPTIM